MEQTFKSIHYINQTGTVVSVLAVKKSKDNKKAGFRACVIISKKQSLYIDEIPFSEDHRIVAENLLKFARGNKYIPVAVKALTDGDETILQGEPMDQYDYIKLNDADHRLKTEGYFELLDEIDDLEMELAAKLKEVKNEYGDQIKEKQEVVDEIRPVLKDGCERKKCAASWERDADAEMMILVRRDNLKPLQIRPMKPEEMGKPDMFDANQKDQGKKEKKKKKAADKKPKK